MIDTPRGSGDCQTGSHIASVDAAAQTDPLEWTTDDREHRSKQDILRFLSGFAVRPSFATIKKGRKNIHSDTTSLMA